MGPDIRSIQRLIYSSWTGCPNMLEKLNLTNKGKPKVDATTICQHSRARFIASLLTYNTLPRLHIQECYLLWVVHSNMIPSNFAQRIQQIEVPISTLKHQNRRFFIYIFALHYGYAKNFDTNTSHVPTLTQVSPDHENTII